MNVLWESCLDGDSPIIKAVFYPENVTKIIQCRNPYELSRGSYLVCDNYSTFITMRRPHVLPKRI